MLFVVFVLKYRFHFLYFKSNVRFSVFYQLWFYYGGNQKLMFCISYRVICYGSGHPVELVQEGNYLIAQRITDLLTGPEATGTHRNTGDYFWASGNIFTLRGDQALAQAAPRGCGVSILGDITSHLDVVLGTGSRWPCLSWGVGPDDL